LIRLYLYIQQSSVYITIFISGSEYHGGTRVQVPKHGTFLLMYSSDIWLTVE